MFVILRKINSFSKRYPVTRGMAAYSVLWCGANATQQKLFGEKKEIDLMQVARFSFFGCFWVAPTLYTWVKIAGKLWPAVTFKTALYKALTDQVTYGPFAITTFYFGMTLLEGKGLEEAKTEVRAKFLSTWMTGWCVWPIVQFVNFSMVPERNRVLVVSLCSVLWTTFLSYMKHLEAEMFLKKNQALAT